MRLITDRWRLTLAIDPSGSAMKKATLEGFGTRLSELRRARGLSQEELADAVSVAPRNRVLRDAEHPAAGALLVDLARTLRVSTDELLGVKPVSEKTSPKTARLLKRLHARKRRRAECG